MRSFQLFSTTQFEEFGLEEMVYIELAQRQSSLRLWGTSPTPETGSLSLSIWLSQLDIKRLAWIVINYYKSEGN